MTTPDDYRRPDGAPLQRVDRYRWTEVLRRLRVKPAVKLTGVFMASYGDKTGKDNFPGIVRLANTTGLDDRTVRLSLKTLRDLGMAYRVFEGSSMGRAGGKADHHVLTLPVDLTLLDLIPRDENDPEREKKREASREADRKRKAAKGSGGASGGASPGGSGKGSPKGSGRGSGDPSRGGGSKEQGISVPEQGTSDTGTGDLRYRNPVSQIPPPPERPPYEPPDSRDHPPARILAPPHADARGAASGYRAFFDAEWKARGGQAEELSDDEAEELRSEINLEYVEYAVNDFDGTVEQSTAVGMLDGGAHPKAVVNKIYKDRGEGEDEYRSAVGCLLAVDQGEMEIYLEAARQHVTAHFDGATERFVYIYAARLIRRDHGMNHRRSA
ncbi:hypothetical protein BJF79_22760 [Actinomadura sp. CNU-125]|uniref:helix-turn-helix domain-containing protein n=1 Tax=Actinomadura sp. CNU-125 TaxID=1904961 RepID=UPI0009685EA1|nr:helix-turn-helix domain-containing protein [Actinomadura sp. CNU-125]OLT12208.1 hypothetical protein BJF79_22760 [Actinomadura sp. CNU-125]